MKLEMKGTLFFCPGLFLPFLLSRLFMSGGGNDQTDVDFVYFCPDQRGHPHQLTNRHEYFYEEQLLCANAGELFVLLHFMCNTSGIAVIAFIFCDCHIVRTPWE